MSRQAEPQAWATVRLEHAATKERVLVMLTDVSETAYYGSPISHADSRVVFPKGEWVVVDE